MTIRSEELSAFCQSVNWRFLDEESSDHENKGEPDDKRTKGVIDAEFKLFECMKELIFFLLNGSPEINEKIKKIIEKDAHNFSNLLEIINFFKDKYPDQIPTDLPADSTVRKVFTAFNKDKNFSEKK